MKPAVERVLVAGSDVPGEESRVGVEQNAELDDDEDKDTKIS